MIAGEACPSGTSSVAGLAFYTGARFPARYRDGLFFADYSRSCIWFMPAGANGLPDPSRRESFGSGIVGIVNLVQGPDGSLYYPDLNNGAVRRISYGAPNDGPTARATATPASGAVPLAVQFDGRGSTDPNGDALTYAWDLDGDGAYDDSTAAQPTRTYTAPGAVTVGLRVTDPGGLQGTTTVDRHRRRAAGGRDRDAGGVRRRGRSTTGSRSPAARRDWQDAARAGVRPHVEAAAPALRRDGEDCHTHTVQTWSGVASGTFVAPDHEYPSYLELELTATDAAGLTSTVRRRLDPKTVQPDVRDQPGRACSSRSASFSGAAPFTRTVIQGSTQGLSAPGAADARRPDVRVHRLVGRRRADARRSSRPRRPRPTGRRSPSRAGRPGSSARGASTRPSGTQAADASGRGNHGTISGATRAAAGRFGGALSFDGVNDWVTVADAAVARPDDGDDARGVGQPRGARRRVAHGAAQGARRHARLRALRARRRARRRPGTSTRARTRASVAPARAAAERVEPRHGDLRRGDAARLRERHAGRDAAR